MSSAAVDKRSTKGRVANECDIVVMLAPFDLLIVSINRLVLDVFAFSVPYFTNRGCRLFAKKQRENALDCHGFVTLGFPSLRHFRIYLINSSRRTGQSSRGCGQNLCGCNL
jgi:hypothetical protein